MKTAIEPKASDFLMPDRKRRAPRPRVRDVEDACFEAVDNGRTPAGPAAAAARSGVFKSRVTESLEPGPFPRDFAQVDPVDAQAADRGERLGVFRAGQSGSESGRSPGMAASGLTLCAVAAAMVWMAGGTAPVEQPAAVVQSASAPGLALQAPSITGRAALLPDPVVTSAIGETDAAPAKAGYTAPTPRPARIERAGSILMIRPSGG
ncbi:hypothetical protein [Hoeflea ulvae]|uniref:Uncharacterized protein n=1 Tax=Hoeflea ulvae TaxID=2983764 RepID=A0ABT3Y9C5_9HYPH|nr:hypothetical protein [Hoeflea ulvae]MCY0092484.1 hypothetical protein [Hoeflea ulvae]